MKQTSKQVERLIRNRQKWLETQTQRGFREAMICNIDEAAQGNTLTALVLLATWSESLALFYGSRGCLNILKEEESGWSDFSGSIECHLWAVRLEIKTYYSWGLPAERRGRAFEMLAILRRAVNLLCHFVAVGNEEREREIWGLIQKPIWDELPAVREWWQERCFEPFMIRLYAKMRGHEVPSDLGQEDLGVYQTILDCWDNDPDIAQALTKACEYHLERIDSTRDRDAEFNRPPFDLMPIEIYAINRLRLDAGLHAVKVNHPLIDAVEWPPVPLPFPDELSDTLYKVIVKHDEFFRR